MVQAAHPREVSCRVILESESARLFATAGALPDGARGGGAYRSFEAAQVAPAAERHRQAARGEHHEAGAGHR
eukprot:4128527-Pleurochrysis_carterae.AAC.1